MASVPDRVRSVTPLGPRRSRTIPAATTAGAKATRSPFTSAAVASGTSPVISSTSRAASASRTAAADAIRTTVCCASAAQADTSRITAPRTIVTMRDQSVSGAAT